MKNSIWLLTLFCLVFGLACGLLGSWFPNYEVKYQSKHNIYNVSLLMDGKAIGPSSDVIGTSTLFGSYSAIASIQSPIGCKAVLRWETEGGTKHEKTFSLKEEIPDEWQAYRDCIIFDIQSDNRVKLSFVIRNGRSSEWYELPQRKSPAENF